MAVTKMWNVGNLDATVDYTVQDIKTDLNAIALTDPETGETYTRADVMAMRHITGWYGQQGQREALSSVLGYAVQPGKTEEKFVTGVNCEDKTACAEMAEVKKLWGKTGGVQGVHAIQSFRPGEVTPEVAHNIGLELARELWGDRFQVVVSTHLDRGHLHNHFVINSVSFKDGKKFYRNNASYDLMRVTSDRLCREYALSVVERPKKGRMPNPKAYDQAGVPRPQPVYQGIRQDIDEAIAHSESMEDFYTYMSAKGYTFRRGNVKYLSLKPPGASKACRIEIWAMKKYGLDYSVDGIRKMILERTQGLAADGEPLPDENAEAAEEKAAPTGWRKEPPKKVRLRRPKGPARPRTRLRGLYLYYCYLFGVFQKKQRHSPGRGPDDQVYKMRRAAERTRFLMSHKIDTLEQLAACRAGIQARIDALVQTRKPLYNRLGYLTEPEDRAAVQAQIDGITAQIQPLRQQVKLCGRIAAEYEDDMEIARRERMVQQMLTEEPPTGEKQNQKEVQKNASGKRSGWHDHEPDGPAYDRGH